MDIIQEVNMTYTLELIIHLCLKNVINMGVTGKLYKYFLSKIQKLENFNRFRKEMEMVLLNKLVLHA
jgi:hypothetical protein